MADNKPSAEKLKALQNAMAKIDKDFGKGAIMRLGDEKIEDVPVIPTGSLGLNYALGVGGYPRGRIIEIYGPESSGKTTLAIHAMAEVQKAGGIAAIIDAEHAFDRFYAEKLGVDVENLLIAQPDSGEQALEIADELIRSAAVDLIVVDSVAALTPKAEIDGDMGDNKVGLQARLMSQALRKMTASVNKTNTTVIFINQLREKIGVMFGNPETTTGGNALKFYASVRLDIRRTDKDRSSLLCKLYNLIDHCIELGLLCLIYKVIVVDTCYRSVCRDYDHIQLVDRPELACLRLGCTGHTGKLVVHTEVVLKSDGCECLCCSLDLHILLRLDRLVESVAPTTTFHDTSGLLIHDLDLSVLDDIVDLLVEHRICLKELVYGMYTL